MGDRASDLADDRFPVGTRVDVWWPGDRAWFQATVRETRTAVHTVKKRKVICREIRCYYDLDAHAQWHSVHNNKIRHAATAQGVPIW